MNVKQFLEIIRFVCDLRDEENLSAIRIITQGNCEDVELHVGKDDEIIDNLIEGWSDCPNSLGLVFLYNKDFEIVLPVEVISHVIIKKNGKKI